MAASWTSHHFLLLAALYVLYMSTMVSSRPSGDIGPGDSTLEEGLQLQEEAALTTEIHIPVSTDLYPGHPALMGTGSSRVKRSTRHRQKNRQPALSGDVVFSARRAFRLYFDFDYSSLSNAEILSAHVILYQTRPQRMHRRNRKSRSVVDDEPEVDTAGAQRERRKAGNVEKAQDKAARVIMHQTIEYGDDVGSTLTTDTKLVDARSRGWLAFDISPALKAWVAAPSSNQGLELWVVSSRAGKRAARTAICMKFVKPNSQRAAFRPELVVKLKPATATKANQTTE